MFEKSLQDLIKGIRHHKKNEREYILKCIEEIRNELKKDDMDFKAAAISKLAYLQMFGYEYSWAAFHIVEVMSSQQLMYKRIGYLAGTQAFKQDTEVLMLATNQLKKDLTSPRYLEVGIAIHGLCQFLTPELAQFLCQDLLNLLSHSKPYVRKRASIALFKVFLKFPAGLRVCFPKLKEKLEDSDASVVTSVVNVICELSKISPTSYLPLVPMLYKLLTTSTNNWMLIKVVKLFATLTPHEPRLIKKLTSPLQKLIETTPAMSLLYECIFTVISGGFLDPSLKNDELAVMCNNKLEHFLKDSDQNLKYIGILALDKLQPIYPQLVLKHGNLVLNCIDDFDYSIRLRAIQLLSKMVTKNSLMTTVKKFIGLLIGDNINLNNNNNSNNNNNNSNSLNQQPWIYDKDPVYRKSIVEAIIDMCSRKTYSNVTNFEWYLQTLLDLVYISKVPVGDLLYSQILDITVRVKSLRPYSVKAMTRLISDKSLYEEAYLPETNSKVLDAAAFILGEYSNLILNPGISLKSILSPNLFYLKSETQIIYLQSVLKIFAFHALSLKQSRGIVEAIDPIQQGLTSLLNDLLPFLSSLDLEVQERAYNIYELLNIILDQLPHASEEDNLFEDLMGLFQAYELNAVAIKAQSKVPLPEDVDLDNWIQDALLDKPLPNLPGEVLDIQSRSTLFSPQPPSNDDDGLFDELENKFNNDDEAQLKAQAREKAKLRKQRLRKDPFYIATQSDSDNEQSKALLPDVESIPIVNLELNSGADGWLTKVNLESLRMGNLIKSNKSKKKNKNKVDKPQEELSIQIQQDELPEGAQLSDNEKEQSKNHKALEVDLTTPLKEEEKLPQIEAYLHPNQIRAQLQQEILKDHNNKADDKKKKKKKKKDKNETKGKKKKSSKNPSKQESTLIDLDPLNKLNEDEKTKKLENSSSLPIINLNLTINNNLLVQSLLNLDEVSLEYNLEGSGPSSLEEAGILIHLVFLNRSEQFGLHNLELKFNENNNLDWKWHGLDLWNKLEVDVLNPKQSKKVTLRICPPNWQPMLTKLTLEGTLTFVDESDLTLRKTHKFQFNLPPSNLLLPPYRISVTPNDFETLLNETYVLDLLTHQFNINLSLPIKEIPLKSIISLFSPLVEYLLKKSNFHLVESNNGAASFFGRSIWGDAIFGMIKLILNQKNDKLNLIVELKSSLKGLEHIETLWMNLIKDVDIKKVM